MVVPTLIIAIKTITKFVLEYIIHSITMSLE